MVPAGLWVMVKYKYTIKGYTLLQTFYVDQVDFSTALVIILLSSSLLFLISSKAWMHAIQDQYLFCMPKPNLITMAYGSSLNI